MAGDIWGGLAAMLVALPSAIAFGVAIVAPLGGSLGAQGAVAGILGATVLGLVAPLVGDRTRLITAPCAPAAAVLSALAAGFAQGGMPAEKALLLLGLIGLFAGVIQIALGLAGIGKLIKFIPFPVVSGYLSGVGLIIIGSQIPKFLGVAGAGGLLDSLAHPSLWVWQSAVVGAVVVAAMLWMPYVTKVVPATILALVCGVACYGVLGWFDPALLVLEHNPLLVGPLTDSGANLLDTLGIRLPGMDLLQLPTLLQVAVPALTLAVLLSIDTLKTCLVIDALTNTSHDANRELIGQGVGNMASSLAGGIPGAGTMGASLINISSGGTTRTSGLVTGVSSLLALVFLAPLIAWVPVAALAGILIVTGFRMIDRHSMAFFYTPATRLDFLVILSVILVAIFGNLIAASGVGVALAILLFIREQTRSSVVRKRTEGAAIFARRHNGPGSLAWPDSKANDSVVFELQGSLFFGTASQLHAALEPEIASHKYVILSMRRVQSLDVTATHVLEQIKDQLEKNDGYLVFCDIPKDLPSGLKMKRFLKDTGVVRPTNKAFAFRQLEDALKWVESRELPQHPELEPMAVVTVDLSAMPLLSQASATDIDALQALANVRTVRAGKKIFKQGGSDDALYLIRSGLVQVSASSHRRDGFELAELGPGDVLCSSGFLQCESPALEAVAVSNAEVYVLSRAALDALAVEHGAVATALVAGSARNLALHLSSAMDTLLASRSQ
ncbi:MAG: cyclic nucleotide-binding domain-containing protein [Rhodoferax sp.]|jgi:SulP family sulfate permease|nr:cyclic nucleotide-binding domain-containing protein [Rhodoferax sp.]